MRHLLIVTAVEAEADAVRSGLRAASVQSRRFPSLEGREAPRDRTGELDAARIDVEPAGVGPAAAAAGAARLLALAEAAGTPYTAVICAGVAGGFRGRAAPGAVVLGTRSIAADLGAESPDGFLPIDELGFGRSAADADPALVKHLSRALPGAITGDILTLATVTGTSATAERLASRHPAAVAEAMEGYGVACAAASAALPFAELRAISNPIGPRDRSAWRLPEALTALADSVTALRRAGPR